jgi:hypothetical protein
MTQILHMPGFTFVVFYDAVSVDYQRDNVDVEVQLSTGERFGATCCTIENVARLMESYRETGENCEGLFFWASDLVVVRDISPGTLVKLAQSLVDTGDVRVVFRKLGECSGLEESGN